MQRFIIFLLLCFSIPAFSQSFVQMNGALQVKGIQLCNESGKPVQLKGFSTSGLMHYPQCITYDALKSIRDFWGGTVVRAAMYVADYGNKRDYNLDPQFNKTIIDSVVCWSERLGIYCIIDWHILRIGDPNDREYAGAAPFFDEMSKKYASKKHVLYEICNEPSGSGIGWDTIAFYANRIIPIIHKNAPGAVILIGTPNWCQNLNQVDPSKLIDRKNVMYTFHFYAATHNYLFPIFFEHIHRIPVFITEWGPCESSGNGVVNFPTAEKFADAMRMHILNGDTVRISWCNYSYVDKNETSASLQPESCTNCQWDNMTPTGFFVREYMKKK